MGYPKERKEAVLKKMMPPHNKPIPELADEEGISIGTLYNWRNQARRNGQLLPDADLSPEGWSSQDKFAAVLETATLNEAELAEYCRKRVCGRECRAQTNVVWSKLRTHRADRTSAEEKKQENSAQTKEKADKKRKARQEKKKDLPHQDVLHHIDDSELKCPSCGGDRFVDVGEGEESFEYEYVPAQIVKIRHIRKKKACPCGACILTAPGPARVLDGCQYGPGLHAHVAVSKCLDSLPLYRQSKRFGRERLSIPKSSLGDMFHRTAELLKPLWQRMLELIGEEDLVNADETSLKVQQKKKTRTAWIWTFLSQSIVTFVYSASRSGKTPEAVLKNSTGIIQVDGYTGYNQVCTPENRERAGCLAHVRRYFFKARATFEDEASWALSQILKLYQVEYDAAEKNILGSEQHLLMRKSRSKELMDEFHKWLLENQDIHPPKSQLSSAIQYTPGQWESLQVFLTDARVSLDNNVSERALRTIAVGRKNFLFVGNDKAGESLAILQSLCASCEVNGINAQAYLADVLLRTQEKEPGNGLDHLLPHNWKPLQDL